MSKEIRCVKCGSKEVVAKIAGNYYCFKCGAELIREHLAKILDELKRKGMVREEG